jgi:hypothetical protein
MIEEFETNRIELCKWAWKRCPFCNSDKTPLSPTAGGGGYQQHAVLQCPECKKSITFTTDWSPIIDGIQTKEYPYYFEDVCPHLSTKRITDNEYLLRCFSRTPMDCFGKNKDDCDAFHLTKARNYLANNNLAEAEKEFERAIDLFEMSHPDWVPPNGMSDLIEVKRKMLDNSEWIKWVEDRIAKEERDGAFGTAAWIAFTMAEGYSEEGFWQCSFDLFQKYSSALRASANVEERWFEKKKKTKECMYAEIMSLEAKSEVTGSDRSALLKLAGNKRHELYELSKEPFQHPNFWMEARSLVNYALAEPEKAAEYYKKASDFILSNICKIEYEREKVYYEGHSTFFLALHYLSLANDSDENDRLSFLEQSIQAFEEAVVLSKKIHLEANGVIALLNCTKAILCFEKFSNAQDYKLIKEAKKFLELAIACGSYESVLKIINALVNIYERLLSVIEEPQKAIRLISQARLKIDNFSKLIPTLRMRNAPIPNILTGQQYYLQEYINALAKSASSFAGKSLTFKNVISSLFTLKELVEKDGYHAFKAMPEPLEEIGRTFVQISFGLSFPSRTLQFREVPVAEGRSDNVLVVDMEKYPFEVKIWHGPKYYEKGLRQIKYYMTKENVDFGFYIIYDNRVKKYKSGGEEISFDGKKIYQIFIHINPESI